MHAIQDFTSHEYSVEGNCPPQALDRMGKHEASKVQRMASLYGLRSSMQGAGRRRIVVVRPGWHYDGKPVACCVAHARPALTEMLTTGEPSDWPSSSAEMSTEHSNAAAWHRL